MTRALYERYSTQIFRYCLHQLGSREEAEDAVQSTFLNAFRGIKRGIVPELESAWLFKIAENVCLSRRRSTWRRNRIESPTDFDVVEELAPAPSRLADELVGLQDVLEQMPENQRRAILLREWQGLSYREIAAELELSQTAVETLIFRARRSLAKGLEEPPAPAQKRRMVRGADLGNLLTGLKSLLFGGGAAAAKVAAVVAVVSAGTVVVASPARHHARTHTPTAPTTSAPAVPPPVSGLASIRPAPAPARVHAAPRPAARVPVPTSTGTPAPTTSDTVVPTAPPASAPVAAPVDAPVTVGSRAAAQNPPAPGRHGGGGSGASGAQAPHERAGSGTSSSSSAGQGQGNGDGQGGQGKNGDSGQGQSAGQGQAQASTDPSSGSGSTPPPPAGGSSTGGNGGNGQGNGQGGGHGH
ncbi:MAG TPA: sigma-70 family RNA polymerase sigma factor [Gaiellaceae bacterium]|nr:sigma-70 family RNA polymerase sigma factor [Gaiellaceae bacterium]